MTLDIDILVLAFFVWRVTHIVVREEGPFSIFETARYIFDKSIVGDILSCFWCCSVWVSLLTCVVIFSTIEEYVVLAFAISGVSIIIDLISIKLK